MVSRHDEKFVLYPAYFDKREPRPLRRVPTEVSVPAPTAEQVAKACAKMRLKPTIEKGKNHPSRWHEGNGRVLVPARGSKSVLLRQIGEELVKLRNPDANDR